MSNALSSTIKILDVVQSPKSSEFFVGHHIDTPVKKAEMTGEMIEISGWIIGKVPVTAIALEHNGKVIERFSITVHRDDVIKAYSNFAEVKAQKVNFGFMHNIDISHLFGRNKLVFKAVLLTKELIDFGVIDLSISRSVRLKSCSDTLEFQSGYAVKEVTNEPINSSFLYGHNIENPNRGIICVNCPIKISGWVAGKSPVIAIETTLDGQVIQQIPTTIYREDLVRHYGNFQQEQGVNAGFEQEIYLDNVKDEQQIFLQAVFSSGNKKPIGKIFLGGFDSKIVQNQKLIKHPLIFVHIPKTAGTSFRNGLEKVFLKGEIAYDYGLQEGLTSNFIREFVYKDKNILKAKEWIFDNKIYALVGHFSASKYLPHFDENYFCAFLREPVQRVISEYRHFVRHYEYRQSLREFAKEESFCNRQSKMLSSLPLRQIGFLGITERYVESLNLFQALFGVAIPYEYTNVAPCKLDVQRIEDEDTISFIKEMNQGDVALYTQALEEFEHRYNNL